MSYELHESRPKTRNSSRWIDLDSTTVDVLERWRAHVEDELGRKVADDDYVFCSPTGAPTHPDRFSQIFNKIVTRAAVPRRRLHDLRHTHATLLLHLPARRPRWLSGEAAAEMHRSQVAIPEIDFGSAIGWACAPSRPWVLAHNGGSRPPGTLAQVTTVPTRDLAVAVLANSAFGSALANAFTQHILERVGVSSMTRRRAATLPDAAGCIGVYERGHARFTVTLADGDGLHIRVDPGPLGDQDVKTDATGTYRPGPAPWYFGNHGYITFIEPDDTGQYAFCHDGRAARRVH